MQQMDRKSLFYGRNRVLQVEKNYMERCLILTVLLTKLLENLPTTFRRC